MMKTATYFVTVSAAMPMAAQSDRDAEARIRALVAVALKDVHLQGLQIVVARTAERRRVL